jgi:iron complex transport system permease protein
MALVKNYQKRIVFSLLISVLILLIIFAITQGSANINMANSARILFKQIPIVGRLVDVSNIPATHQTIIIKIRLPRIILAMFVGAALAVSGAAFQGMFKNSMADPYVIGISSGAALGAAIGIVSKLNVNILGLSSISIFAFVGALLSTFIVYNLARVKSRVPTTNLLLSGIAVGYFFTSIMSLLMFIFSRDLANIVFWTLGSFSARNWNHVNTVAIPITIGIAIIYFYSRDLNVMLMGEENAYGMGINVEKVKKVILITCAMMTAFAVSVTGIIGFVGLIIPHIVRIVLGPDHRVVIPAAAITGGIFLIITDTISRTVISPMEIPIGIITAILGGPFFIYLLRKKKTKYFG